MSWNEGEGLFLKRLVETRSESSDEEACSSLLASMLPGLGWNDVYIDQVGNVIASRGDGPKELLMMGHIDTVPGGPDFKVDGDVLWGRGSVDAKGPLISFAIAGGRAEIPAGWSYTFIAAVGEETDSRGAKYVMETRDRPDCCIIGEPSGGDGVTLAYRGCLFFDIYASDGGAHRSGDSGPLSDLVMAASCIMNKIHSMDDSSLPVIERYSSSVYHMEGVEEGRRHGSISLDVRLPIGADPVQLFEEIKGICDEWKVQISLTQSVKAHRSRRNDPVVMGLSSAIRQILGKPRVLAKGGTADFNVVAPWNIPMAAYGPGDSRLDHSDEEHLIYDDFSNAIKILDLALPKICSIIDR